MEIMKDPMLDHHVDDLRLPYLEGLLGPEERSKFEDHVRKCPDCTSKLEEMSHWASVFENNARDMCPEGWQLFDYVRTGQDSTGMVSSHLEKCPLCLAEAESYKAHPSSQAMPEDLWKKMQSLSGKPTVDRSAGPSYQWVWETLDRIRDLFRPAVLAPVAVAAVLLIVVFLYPAGPAPRMVALSSVNWGPDLTLMSKGVRRTAPVEAKKERLGAVILLSNFKRLPDQDRIDSFYRAIEPAGDIRERYEILSPDKLKQMAGEEPLRAVDDKALAEGMRSRLKISKALVIEIVSGGEKYGILSRLVDTSNGATIKKRDSWNLTEAELPSALEDATRSLLTP
jgi:hypothetical protein